MSLCEDYLAHFGQPEAVPSGSISSSRTASSTSLAPRRSRSGSRRKSLSRTTSSVDAVEFRRRPVPVPDQDQTRDERSSERTYGGYRVLTFGSVVAEERERPPKYRLAKDLPHSLQDYMNTLPNRFRNSDVAREIFEAHIQHAMNNEPDAPSIEIFDNAIGDEVTPPWEFHYTNEMWYGERVPPPNVKGLESCGCVGRCDPKSGKCACAKRQLRWVQPYIEGEIIPPTWPGSPFAYDHKGLLQRLECPIFECNRFCACDEDCPNRVRAFCVYLNDADDIGRWCRMGASGLFISQRRPTRAGVIKLFLTLRFLLMYVTGVVAGNKKISKGSYIGSYAGELLTEQEGEARGKYV